mgnify:CR=1 FL=1
MTLNALSKGELQDLIDQEHMAVFGMTRKQRRIEKKLGKKEEVIDWSAFDRPAIERNRQVRIIGNTSEEKLKHNPAQSIRQLETLIYYK